MFVNFKVFLTTLLLLLSYCHQLSTEICGEMHMIPWLTGSGEAKYKCKFMTFFSLWDSVS